MADNKKYYYLKLKDNFFDNDAIKTLEGMTHGYECVNILLKLYVRSDYYKRGYRSFKPLTVEGKIDFITSICVLVNHDNFTVNFALEAFKDLKLLEIEDNILILKDLNVDLERDRDCKEYREWRKKVFERDNYICSFCQSQSKKLNAHHVKPWKSYPDLRFDISNGITLCESCHKKLHKTIGR